MTGYIGIGFMSFFLNQGFPGGSEERDRLKIQGS